MRKNPVSYYLMLFKHLIRDIMRMSFETYICWEGKLPLFGILSVHVEQTGQQEFCYNICYIFNYL